MNKLFAILIALLLTPMLSANNITITNLSLTGKNATDNFTLVQFDISWENSWLTSSAPNNWDAAWVFVKYRVTVTNGGDGLWHHAWLNNTGHTAPAGSTIDIGLQSPGSAFNATTNPGLGAFFYRSADGTGTFTKTGVQLRWNYGSNYKTGTTPIGDDDIVDVQVFAIEMVCVPEGTFTVGSGGTESGSFTNGSWSTGATAPLSISSESALTIAHTTGNLWGTSESGNNTIGSSGTLAAAFPKGYGAFYCMKYELSQQQYVDFLNTLTSTQASNRYSSGSTGYRYGLSVSGGVYSTTNPYVACNYLSWMDGAAYTDWAGLRPMTELEFEKACRGTATPVAGEYAWGNTSIAGAAYTLGAAGTASETIATNYSATAGNANYLTTGGIAGPLRVGIFAGTSGNTGRVTAGSTFYGIMEMSGNLWERTVTVGNATGRGFTGVHGNGTLSDAGFADISTWPGYNANEVGSGFRGGSGGDFAPLCVSDRFSAAEQVFVRSPNHGFRAVRSIALPSLTTTGAASISFTTATSGGNITSDGGVAVTARGVCYSTTTNPTTAGSYTTNGSGTGDFTSSLTGLASGTTYYIRAYATTLRGTSYGNEVSFTTLGTCGSFTINHVTSGGAAAVTKTVTYGTVTGIPGLTNKCWITSNLGADRQANDVVDVTEASAGWYWQFNRKQGYKHDGTTRTPNAAWITSISESSDWIPANDPCALELGTGWRIPTLTEWSDVDASGGWTNYNYPWNSGLKMHAAGYLQDGNGALTYRGSNGYYWSSIQASSDNGDCLYLHSGACSVGGYQKADGFSLRCLRDMIPTVSTTAISNIGATTATGGGNVISECGSGVTERGVCWSTTTGPTIANSHTTNGTGAGAFTSNLTSLTSNTKYYVRAYATNSVGTAYGNEISFTTLLAIGDLYQGGRVAYILQHGDPGYDASMQKGLIAATADQSTIIAWITGGSTQTTLNGNTLTALGKGQANTNFMMAQTGYTGGAAKVCDDYTNTETGTGVYSDWYLPSKDELNKLYSNKLEIGGFTVHDYWSSSEINANSAYLQSFGDGHINGNSKSTSFYVRAVRSFPAFTCGTSFTVNHETSGGVAPVDKSVTYGTVSTTLFGGTKCAITQNLGADHQATAKDDATEASAGWYWQFNRKQGYQYTTSRTPAGWDATNDNSSATWEATKDPCTLELGAGWRIPTKTEWTAADALWINYNDAYGSLLKLHAAGYLLSSDGSLNSRGSGDYYWSSTQNEATYGWYLFSYSSYSGVDYYLKMSGFPIRCLKDY